MSRPRRSDAEIAAARDHILRAALELFNDQGYREVSMRMVARKAGCSAAAIYRYYPHKDALYLDVLKSGFQMLLTSLKHDPPAPTARTRMDRLVRLFYEFSLKHPTYYDLMFTFPVPKYLDYVGTEMEGAAWEEKRVAVANLELAVNAIKEGISSGEYRADADPGSTALAILAACHGIISSSSRTKWPSMAMSTTSPSSATCRV